MPQQAVVRDTRCSTPQVVTNTPVPLQNEATHACEDNQGVPCALVLTAAAPSTVPCVSWHNKATYAHLVLTEHASKNCCQASCQAY